MYSENEFDFLRNQLFFMEHSVQYVVYKKYNAPRINNELF